jgi:hypothetical protein
MASARRACGASLTRIDEPCLSTGSLARVASEAAADSARRVVGHLDPSMGLLSARDGSAHAVRLSEAIRLGAMLKPQGFWSLLTADGHTCALGAALDAIGASPSHFDEFLRWPVLTSSVTHPVTGTWWVSAYGCIADLNDTHRWTREQIAGWVASIEDSNHAGVSETGEGQRTPASAGPA